MVQRHQTFASVKRTQKEVAGIRERYDARLRTAARGNLCARRAPSRRENNGMFENLSGKRSLLLPGV